MRPYTSSAQKPNADVFYHRASMALFAVLACLILLTFSDYGITWDEPGQNRYGSLILRFYWNLLHGRFDLSAIAGHLDFGFYGGLFDSVAAAVEHVSPWGEFETRHLLNAMVGFLGVLGCWKAARILAGPAAAFWAALFLVLTPRYYGHMFNNPKDLPFAVGYVWTFYYLMCAIPGLPRIPWKTCLKLAFAIGLTLSVRVGGVLLIAYLLLLQVSFLVWSCHRSKSHRLSRDLFDTAVRFIAIVLPAWSIMLLFWPWAQGNPLLRPFQALNHFSSMPWYGKVLFDGAQVQASQLPRSYTLRWFLISLPEFVVILTALAIVIAVQHLFWRQTPRIEDQQLARCLLAAFVVCFPLIYIFVTKPVLYDAERHSLYLVPPLISICAGAWVWSLDRISIGRQWLAIALIAAMIGYLSWQVSILVRLHPHEYVYFNQFVGGLRGASGRYETDYWGNSYHEAVNMLVEHVRSERQINPAKIYKIYMTSTQRVSATYYFPAYFTLTARPEDADFSMATTRYNTAATLKGCVVAEVTRFDVPLAIVKDLLCSREQFPPAAKSRGEDTGGVVP